jgi:4-amino-4-deoxy-L-arabinose transferase-like glycosyltransferase
MEGFRTAFDAKTGLRAPEESDVQTGLNRTLVCLLILTAVLLTRFSWAPSYLSTDTVNLAYALESFDPVRHQPQPPGYPFFVAFARLVHWFSPTAEVTFWIVSVLLTFLAASATYSVALRMFGGWAAISATILFLLNPVLWFTRLRSPLRPALALFSALVAYCAWRAWNGDRRFVLWGAVALGLGSGFRPDLLAYLLPLWVVSAWRAAQSWRAVATGGVIVAAFCAAWLYPVVLATGGIGETVQLAKSYVLEQSSKDSLLFSQKEDWLRPVSRLVVWNGLGVIGWVWVPVLFFRKIQKAVHGRAGFLVVWLLPGLVVQALFHIASPGHTLFATPVWCIAGGYALAAAGRFRDALLAIAITINVALFLNVVPLGEAPPSDATRWEKIWTRLSNAVAYGTFETSIDRLRWWDERAEVTLQELRKFSVTDRPAVIVALNGTETEFDFMNWRVASYYMDEPMVVLMDNLPPGAPGRVRWTQGKETRFQHEGDAIQIPASARIVWILFRDGKFQREVEKVLPLQSGRYVAYSDLPDSQSPFEVAGFKFAPGAKHPGRLSAGLTH